MIIYPCAKINLGLNITSVRPDGYHDIESVFYPIPLSDALEVHCMNEGFPSNVACDIKTTGNYLDCDDQKNLVIKAYNLLAKDYKLPHLHAHLYKEIPSQAGLGGGSSDASFMIKLLNRQFNLGMNIDKMREYAVRIGADCPFFINAEPAFATGIGEILTPLTNNFHLNGYYIVVVKPDVAVSTAEAYKQIIPHKPHKSCLQIVNQPIETWKNELTNDFEIPAFEQYPELYSIKNKLYSLGAIYAQMSGSGSAIYGLFNEEQKNITIQFDKMLTFTSKL